MFGRVFVACFFLAIVLPSVDLAPLSFRLSRTKKIEVASEKELFGAVGLLLSGGRQRAEVGGEYGGVDCAGCGIIVTILEQLAIINEQSIVDVVENACKLLPDTLQEPCDALVEKFGPEVIRLLEAKETPDEICLQLKVCTNPSCKIDPTRKKGSSSLRLEKNSKADRIDFVDLGKQMGSAPGERIYAVPKETPWEWLKKQIERVADKHEPLVDVDQDLYSIEETLRGSSWRGRDCNDFDNGIYPGRKQSTQPAEVDHNCNGIYGTAPDGEAYEDMFCKDSEPRGVAVLGDSAAAHFHIPAQWMNASEISKEVFEHTLFVLENEFDWPQKSAYSGYDNKTNILEEGRVSSVYLHMRKRNRCNHRDYQNCGVNGARVSSMADTIEYSLARNQNEDHPLLVFHALIGNDICNGHHSVDHFTKPDDFEKSVLKTLAHLDTVLPSGSTVVLVGLVDGRILWDTMANLTHPLGIKYWMMYEYLNCLYINPCWGWLNSNETVRNEASEWAAMLSDIYPKIMSEHTYKNFDMIYISYAEVLEEAVAQMKKEGIPIFKLIEPIDGFHPSQFGNALTADIMFNKIASKYPHAVGPENPHNAMIEQLFGDQGGY